MLSYYGTIDYDNFSCHYSCSENKVIESFGLQKTEGDADRVDGIAYTSHMKSLSRREVGRITQQQGNDKLPSEYTSYQSIINLNNNK